MEDKEVFVEVLELAIAEARERLCEGLLQRDVRLLLGHDSRLGLVLVLGRGLLALLDVAVRLQVGKENAEHAKEVAGEKLDALFPANPVDLHLVPHRH